MDGNNRWAKKRMLPGGAGHKAGESALRRIVEHAARQGIEVLTVFAFSSESAPIGEFEPAAHLGERAALELAKGSAVDSE